MVDVVHLVFDMSVLVLYIRYAEVAKKFFLRLDIEAVVFCLWFGVLGRIYCIMTESFVCRSVFFET